MKLEQYIICTTKYSFQISFADVVLLCYCHGLIDEVSFTLYLDGSVKCGFKANGKEVVDLANLVRTQQLNPAIFADWLDDHREFWTSTGDVERVLEVLRRGW